MTKEKSEITKVEMLLTLNDNIVVQRYFNVKDYNEMARKSTDFYYVMCDVHQKIEKSMKDKTLTYMMDNIYQIMEDPMILETSNTDDAENFNLYIKIGDDILHHRMWDGKVYPPKVRYTVDIRPHLKGILRSVTEVLSTDKLSYKYMEYKLS
jgi:hypothetical protein